MKRKYASYAASAYKGYNTAKRTYKKIRKVFNNRASAKYQGRIANVTTVQKDVQSKKTGRRVSKKVIAKQKAFRSKIEKALAPLATHHTYIEQNSGTILVTKVGGGLPNLEQYTSTAGQEIYALNAGFVNPNGITYCAFNLNTLSAQAGAVSTGATASSSENNRDLVVLSSEMDLSLTNPSPIAMVYDVYWCVATQSTSDPAYATPIATMSILLTQNLNLSGSGGVIQTPNINGVQPQDVVGFGKYWKILQKERVYLNPQATSEFNFKGGGYTYKPQKFQEMVNVAGHTKCLLIIGGIGDNTGLAAGNGAMRLVTTRRYRVRYPTGGDKIPTLPTCTSRTV